MYYSSKNVARKDTLLQNVLNICISNLQLLHFQKFLLEVVAIGRKNAGKDPDTLIFFYSVYAKV